MPRSRSSMRQIREILRLKWELGLSNRRIARGCGLSRPTVSKYVRRATACGLSWPLPASLTFMGALSALLGWRNNFGSAQARMVCPRWHLFSR